MRRPKAISVTGVSSGTAFATGDYAFDGAGNITAMGTDSFYYDDRMRLEGATVHGIEMDFFYDDFGNLRKYYVGGSPTEFTISSVTNRISDVGTAEYDAAGNTTKLGGIYFEYDELNQLTHREPDGGPNDDALWVALYTADDERLVVLDAGGAIYQERWTLRDLGGSVLSQYLYNVSTGELLFEDGFETGDTCEWSASVGGSTCLLAPLSSSAWYWARDYIYREGQLLAEIDGGEVLHLHLDHLGSLRQVTGSEAEVVEDHDFLPFGQEDTLPGTKTMLFTGHERDHHTGSAMDDLDYMHARYYSPHVGRFLSVDPVTGNPRAPQSWNHYSYVVNNPMKYVDPTGMFPCPGLPEVECDDEITVIGEEPKGNPVTGLQGAGDLAAGRGLLNSLGSLDFIPGLLRRLGFNVNSLPGDVLFIDGEFRNAGPSAEELVVGAVGVAAAAAIIGNRNPAQDKRLTKGEIRDLKRHGIDPEELKRGQGKRTGRSDLFKDQKGNIYVKPKDGSGPGEPTGFNTNDFKKR